MADKDIALILTTRTLRSFSLAYIAFLLPIYLKAAGFSVELIGVYALLATFSSSLLVLLSGFMGDIFSRRKTLIVMGALPALAYLIILTTTNITALLASSVFGLSLSAAGGGAGGGPVAPLQTAMIASRTVSATRTKVYSYLNIFALSSSIIGSLFSGVIISAFPEKYFRILFIVAFLLTIVSVVAVFPISERPDEPTRTGEKSILPRRSSRNIAKIGMAGALGSLGLGMIVPLMPIYFERLGGTSLSISIVYDTSYLLTAVVMFFSSRIEARLGSIRGIFALRSVGSLLLITIPFTSSIIFAAFIYVLRTAIYQAALPMRQNVSMELYSPEERSRASGITSVARRMPYGIATILGSVLFTLGEFILLFTLSALIAFLDPVFYYVFFRSYSDSNHTNLAARSK